MEIEMTIPSFSGFYESCWYCACQDNVDYLTDDTPKHADDWSFSAKGLDEFARDYGEDYLLNVNRTLGLSLSCEKAEMVSPREYNFSTDKIWMDVEVSEENLNRVLQLLGEHKEELRKEIKENHSSRDGFISFMSNDIDEWIATRLDNCDGMYFSYAVHYLFNLLEGCDFDELIFEVRGFEMVSNVIELGKDLQAEYDEWLNKQN